MESKCMRCGREAAVYRPYSGEVLCRRCFTESVEIRVRRTISRYRMLQPDSRIAVAVSGGKDSVVLLHVLAKLEERFPKSELIAVTVDEGIEGYRNESLEIIEEAVRRLQVPWLKTSFKELFGRTLDEIIRAASEILGERRLGACTYCGVLRRRAINTLAVKAGADVVATAHNLDDEAQTILMNILKGDLTRFLRNKPARRNVEGFVPRVKPLREIPEEEIVLYAYFNRIRYHETPCPYHAEAYRDDVRAFINKIETQRPGTKYNIVRIHEKITQLIPEEEELKVSTCTNCGQPASSEKCKVCQLLEEIGGS
ncbi:MAG: TIGR00269 family protein [Candidatus Jordarchaeales archaeon]|nr:TIGR00269 family protein [Candidatus Jordarchaeia archaeon]